VMEHFYQPNKEFSLLKSLLKKGGRLYCMTDIYHAGIDFQHWSYKNDPSHVFFYHRDSLAYINAEFNFSAITIDGRLITYYS